MILIVVYEGLLIAFWFIDHGYAMVIVVSHFKPIRTFNRQALRWYCLFIGVMKYASFIDTDYINLIIRNSIFYVVCKPPPLTFFCFA